MSRAPGSKGRDAAAGEWCPEHFAGPRVGAGNGDTAMASLEILEGTLSGTTVVIDGKMTIGRNASNSLCLADTSVSRQHAEIWQKGDYYVLIDLGSANGTFVNGVPLHKLVPRPLYDNDEILIGSSRLVFRALGAEPPGSRKSPLDENDVDLTATRPSPPLSVIMTAGEHRTPSVSATIDASRSMLESLSTDQRQSPRELLDAIGRLQSMVKVSNDLGAVSRPEALAERIMISIFDIFPKADRAFIMLRDATDGELRTVAARKRSAPPGHQELFAVSRSIISTVVDQKQSMLLSDALADSRFSEKQSVVDLSIRSMMCAPFICKDEILGVIGVDTLDGANAFNANDLAMLTAIAAQAAIAIKNSALFLAIEKETQVRTQLSRYLSPDVVEGVIGGKIPLHLGGEKKRGTILFCDIVGFTSIAENLPALEVVNKLNRYFSIITDIITHNRGTLHKFAGDMVMAFWNVMFADTTAEAHAIRTGLELQTAVWRFNMDLEHEGQRPVFLGIGCNTGEFAGGNIGGTNRMEYTVIGDNVNLAQRIESLACRWQVLVASETWQPAKDDCIAIGLTPVTVKGRQQPIKVYSIRGMRLSADSTLLDIPAHILTPDGAVAGWGLLTSIRTVCGGTELLLSTNASIASWNQLTIQFDLPELSSAPRLSARVSAAGRTAHGGRATYTLIALCDIRGDQEAIALLKPGTVVESRRSWADMKRH